MALVKILIKWLHTVSDGTLHRTSHSLKNSDYKHLCTRQGSMKSYISYASHPPAIQLLTIAMIALFGDSRLVYHNVIQLSSIFHRSFIVFFMVFSDGTSKSLALW